MKFYLSIFSALFATYVLAAPVPTPDTDDSSVDQAFVNVAYFGLKERDEASEKAKRAEDDASVDQAFVNVAYFGLKEREAEAEAKTKRSEDETSVDQAFVNVAYFGLKE